MEPYKPVPVVHAPIVTPAPHVNLYDIEQKNIHENIYMSAPSYHHVPYHHVPVTPVAVAPVVRPAFSPVGMILVLFILLVIILRGVGFGRI